MSEAYDSLRALSKNPEMVLCVFTKPWTLPAETADLAASRLEWAIDHLDKEHPDRRTPLYEMRSSLGLVQLWQRRPQEVQGLCADALAAKPDPDDRATVLAIVAMARHSLLLSGRRQLDEALALGS